MAEQIAIQPSAFPRGSEWRKWDPHVHTPDSALANAFSDWESYVDALELRGADIAAIGVTDYCSIEGYKKLLTYREAGRLANVHLLFPNIEFRLAPKLAKGSALNIHVLIDPSASDHVTQIEDALSGLRIDYQGNPYACTTSGLIRLGRAFKGEQLDEQAALRTGIGQFKPDLTAFHSWLKDHKWLRTNSLVAVSNGWDGLAGLRVDSGFNAYHDQILRISDLVFSANPSDREYYLGEKGNAEQLQREIGGLRPCIHGSDAHDEDRLFNPDHSRYCWIKADPTFEGLRQVLHEPATRVYIGASAPSRADKSQVISRVLINDLGGWFENSEIPLNPGLVCIIGEKGSGKTALADLIAFAGGAWNSEGDDTSFISRAGSSLGDTFVQLEWGNKSVSPDNPVCPYGGETGSVQLIRYLSQDFVERLCTTDVSGGELVREIERVVFEHLSDSDRLEAPSFDALRRMQTREALEDRRRAVERIREITERYIANERQAESLPSQRERLAQNEKEIAALEAQMPALEAGINKESAERLSELQNELQMKRSELGQHKRRQLALTQARSAAERFVRETNEAANELRGQLLEVGLTENEASAFAPDFSDVTFSGFERVSSELQSRIEILEAEPDQDAADRSIPSLDAAIQIERLKLAEDEQLRARVLEARQALDRKKLDQERFEAEIKRIESIVPNRRMELLNLWSRHYKKFFETIEEEEAVLKSLYRPLERVLGGNGKSDSTKLELFVERIVDQSQWIKRGEYLFDQRKAGPRFDSKDDASPLAALIEVWRHGSGADIESALESALRTIGNGPDIDAKVRSHVTRADVLNWLFDPTHVRLDYSLRYEGEDLRVLSPGTRGIVLLKLYLSIDEADTRPLLIDQPEGNLDNSSVYEALVPFLREAKRRRQIVLVTHNPNLVVTTDADQVIVATASRAPEGTHPTIGYALGSLEQARPVEGIRPRAIRLLEGGAEPFGKRSKRYALSQQG